MTGELKAPFPWFGGKSKVADIVWQELGDVGTYIEPFAGSLAVLLNRPHAPNLETVNDIDGYIVNFWRAIAHAPDEVAHHADWPVSEIDLTARHLWLVTTGKERVERLSCDPDYFDAKVAGWWVWGLCSWIGDGWCSGNGPWTVHDGKLEKGHGRGVSRRIPFIGAPMGINSKFSRLANSNRGAAIMEWFEVLSSRLRDVRICQGDWRRVLNSDACLHAGGEPGIFLDPPYDTSHEVYSVESAGVAEAVREWAKAHGDLRIVLCGYEGEYEMAGWRKMRWQGSAATYGSKKRNNQREVLWLSPACTGMSQQGSLGL
jgi:site-specific DNA-adenine methylase